MTALAKIDRALGPSHPTVIEIALRVGWRPETLAARIAEALPAPVEQQLYLRVAESIRILPKTVAKILDELRGAPIHPRDMAPVEVGKHLFVNRFQDILELTLETISLTHELSDTLGPLGSRMAARLVAAYGPDNVNDIAASLARWVDETYVEDQRRERRLALVTQWFCHHGLEWCRDHGVPYPLDFGLWLEANHGARRSLYNYAGPPPRDAR